ncbi:MAG: HAD hydrolase-like protein [Timaviella obliquedivisa GSE-PSE-MK23-08B]|jgi:phosphoglycolate phosphatase-like HAD superfamily hydrolase|nr:HAD hydrolase-like protein [Timaviella obliquedivisa GSE-PSE-MK23-08B]
MTCVIAFESDSSALCGDRSEVFVRSHASAPSHDYRSSSPVTLFCDFDGPIVDVSDRYYSTYQLGLAEIQSFYQTAGISLPIRILSKEQFWQMKQERTPDVEIAMRSGLQGQEIDHFLQRVTQIVNQPTLLHQDQLQPGVRWALALLQAQGVRLVLVTLRCQVQATQMLQSYGLAHIFSEIWGTQDSNAAYSNQSDHKTQLLGKAIAHLSWTNHSPAHAWMLGDTEADVLAGKAMSIPTIAVSCGIRSHNYLQKLQPTCIHTDLLSAVHHLVDSK